ncbi:TetR/AcrR family transcriptional regulator C-terminal domain-containing protein [Scatolibacter rhodanostii]|uniref:TetR/AcrR family transcriptional regulator C-terminal domain-containing protein n=1 Tax=Scatolibacter rhodanostii TaxID=2014781 RepID=UPI000C069600|nr:TetR/AcrR family transcriptional regulator C-terminal domain-containing protein [Scatolibacter rhodanostii]
MADSNITKRALAASLKELMEESSFSKINIADICEKCEMNRKSFYYHFKDKYDLVNWIYQTEFISVAKEKDYAGAWDFMEDICAYLFEHSRFYRKAFLIEGQNSFFDYFTEILSLFIGEYIEYGSLSQENADFYLLFLVDAFTSAIRRWLLSRESQSPKEFVTGLKACIRFAAEEMA